MPAQIVKMEDCASCYGAYEVHSVSNRNKVYIVSLDGESNYPHCTCPAYQFSGNSHSCKHILEVYKKACLYNPQWHDANENPEIRPISYGYDRFTDNKCACGGPMVAVLRAV